MNTEKTVEELLARVQALEEKVAAISQKVGVADTAADSGDKEKRCLPGFNTCEL